MKITITIKTVILLCIVFSIELVFAQQISIVPNDEQNNRFFTEFRATQRPSLSLNGFDNKGLELNGYGLKQLINRALEGDQYIINEMSFVI